MRLYTLEYRVDRPHRTRKESETFRAVTDAAAVIKAQGMLDEEPTTTNEFLFHIGTEVPLV